MNLPIKIQAKKEAELKKGYADKLYYLVNNTYFMTPEKIIDIVFKITGSWPDLVFSKSRMTRNVKTRQFIHYFIKKYINMLSFREIGIITGSDHATVMHSILKINELDFNKWQPWFDYKIEIDKTLQHSKPIKISFKTWNYSIVLIG